LSLSSLWVKLFGFAHELYFYRNSSLLITYFKLMASQVEGRADIGLAGGLGSGGEPSQLHDTKLYAKVAFPSPLPPNGEYQRWKGDQGEQNGRHQYKLEFNIYTGTGDPNPDIGDPSDIYFNLVCSRIFAKLDSQRWEYWNMTKLRISDIKYPVMEYPFNSRLHLWPKADVGVQWYHQDNFKTQRSRRKDEVVEVEELIQLTLKYWDNTEPKKTNARGKKRKTEETSTIDPSPHPSTPSGSSQILALGAMGAPGPSNLVQRLAPPVMGAPTPFGSSSTPTLMDTRFPNISKAPDSASMKTLTYLTPGPLQELAHTVPTLFGSLPIPTPTGHSERHASAPIRAPTPFKSSQISTSAPFHWTMGTSNPFDSSRIPSLATQSSQFPARPTDNTSNSKNPTVEGRSPFVFQSQPPAEPASTEPSPVYEDVDMDNEPLALEQPDRGLENSPVPPTPAGPPLVSDQNLSTHSHASRSESPLMPVNSPPNSMSLDHDTTTELGNSVTLKLPPLNQNKRKEGSNTNAIAKVTKYVFQAARTFPELFINRNKFPKASMVTWVNGMKTMLPGGPKWGKNAVSRIQVIYL
jgi:hypothetical protein